MDRDLIDRKTECDVLIVGGGVAGCMAAVEASETDTALRVIVMEKAAIRRSGAAARGMDALNVVMIPGQASAAEYLESIDMMSQGVFDEKVSRRLVDESFSSLKRLEGWGVEFPKNEAGEYLVSQFHPRGRFMVEMRGGDFKPILAQQVKKHGIHILERTVATKLFVKEGEIRGAAGFNVRTGKLIIVEAKAVILTCGGAGRIGLPQTGYLHGTFNYPYNSGDGYSLALRAGVELTNFEATWTSSTTKDYNGPGLSTFIRHNGHMVNALGERFLSRYAPDHMERAPAGIRYKATWKEIQEGRGPIYFDLTHLTPETLSLIEEGIFTVERPTTKQFLESRGIDPRKDWIEVILSETYMEGGHGMTGVIINDEAETNIRGLYAAGDIAANPFGFLTAALVFGRIAGRNAADYAKKANKPTIEEEEAEAERRCINALFDERRTLDPSQFEYKTRRIVNEYLQPPKTERKLLTALGYVERLKKDANQLRAEDPHQAMKALEAISILDCVEMATLASLERKESRWGLMHLRVDYPKRDDQNWLKYVVVKMGEDREIKTETRPIGGA